MLKPKSSFRTQEEYIKYLTSELRTLNKKLRQQVQFGLCEGDLYDQLDLMKLLLEAADNELKAVTCSAPSISKPALWGTPSCVDFVLTPFWEELVCIPNILSMYVGVWSIEECLSLQFSFKNAWESAVCLGDISNISSQWEEGVCSNLTTIFKNVWKASICVETPNIQFNNYWDKTSYVCVSPAAN